MTKLQAVKSEQSLYRPKKLSIACGQNKPKGFTGIDLAGDADIVHDLWSYPWPIASNSVLEVECSHFVEHIPHYRPEWPKDGWWMFFDELWRITRKNATLTFHHPYAMSGRADWDPTHERRIHEMSWYYTSKEWRTVNGLDHYPTEVDFEVVVINATGVPDEIMNRSIEAQSFARAFYWNVVADLEVVLRRK